VRRLLSLICAGAVLALSSSAMAADQFFTVTNPNLGTPILARNGSLMALNAGGNFFAIGMNGVTTIPGANQVAGMSADGLTYAGIYQFGPGDFRYAIWSGNTAFELQRFNGATPFVRAISADGSVVVGDADPGNVASALIWDAAGVVHELAHYPGGGGNLWSRAMGVSDDGAFIVGYAAAPNWSYYVTRWRQSDLSIEVIGPGQTSLMSGDGSTIAASTWLWVDGANGGARTDSFQYVPGSNYSNIQAMTANGRVIVGQASLSPRSLAFRWDNGVGATLGDLGGDSMARALSSDGEIVVGFAVDGGNVRHAVRWGATGAVSKVADLLTAGGVDISGWQLQDATGISEDGNTIVGTGIDSSNALGAWLARCLAACRAADASFGIITADVAARSFAAMGAVGATTSLHLASELSTAGDMASSAEGSGASVTGFAYGAYDSDPTTSASIGATVDLGDDLFAGGTLGATGILTEMPNGGSAIFSGPSLTAFIASRPDTGLNWTVGASVTGLTGTIRRGYLNGNTPVTSSGNTSGAGFALSAEAGWTFEDLLADVLVTPFVNVTVSSASYAGYTETGSPFPAAFSGFSTSSAVFKVGVDGRYAFATDSYLTGGVAYGHNASSGGSIAGNITGAMALSASGVTMPADFIEAGIGIDMPLRDAIRFSGRLALTAPFGGPASVQARAGITMAF